MKCPYRVQVNKAVNTVGYERKIKETVEYAECYEEDCPLYNLYEDRCGRALQEIGGEA